MPADGYAAGGGSVHFLPRPSAPAEAERINHIEQSFLAAVLMQPHLLEALPPGFGPQHLWVEGHDQLFDAIRNAAETGAKHLAPLVERTLPDMAGPNGYVRSLYKCLVLVHPEDVAGYARALMDLADRRTLVEMAEELKRSAAFNDEGSEPTTALVARATDTLERIMAGQRAGRRPVRIGEAMRQAIEAGVEAAKRGDGLTGISTGFRCLDERLGGLEGGAVYVLGARPGVGKTSLALQVAMRVAQRGEPVLFVSLEMQAKQLARRALSLETDVGIGEIKRGWFARDTAQSDRMVATQQRHDPVPLLIVDEGGLPVPGITLRAKAAQRAFGRLSLIVVDHLHIVGRPESAGRHGDTQAITEISMGIKRIAKDLDVPVLLLAQLNRGVEGREEKRPGLADLRQSGAVEQDAEAVMFIYRPDYYTANVSEDRKMGETEEAYGRRMADQAAYVDAAAGRAEILFEKVRDGERGVEHMRFDGPRAMFYEEGAGA